MTAGISAIITSSIMFLVVLAEVIWGDEDIKYLLIFLPLL